MALDAVGGFPFQVAQTGVLEEFPKLHESDFHLAYALVAFGVAVFSTCGGGTSTPAVVVSPTPTSTATGPTPTSSGATPSPLSASPSPRSFTATGYTLTFVASESNYSGTLGAASSDCSGVATFSPSSASGPSATFSAVSVAAGKCHVTVSDAYGQQTTVTVDVTTTTGAIQ